MRLTASRGPKPGWTTVAWLIALTVVGAAIRAYQLGAWPLADDEIFTLRDSRIMAVLQGPKPLLFFLNYHLFGPDRLDELTLRILPAAFGVLSVPMVYWATRGVATPAAGLIAALLVVGHPEHVYWSQFARYHTLLFLAATLYPFALYRGVRNRSLGWVGIGAAAAAVGGLAHPSALLPLVGVGIWAAYELVKSRDLNGRRLAWSGAVALAIGVVTLSYAVPILRRWLELDQRHGFGSLGIHISHLNAMTPALAVAAGLGVLWLVRERASRSLGVFLALWIVVPALFLSLVAFFASVYTGYLWATAPAFFVAGALFVHRCATAGPDGYARWLAPVGLVGMMIVTSLPSLLSQFMDGSRVDLRSPAELVRVQARPGDVVLADGGNIPLHYLDGAEGLSYRPFERDEARLADALQELASRNPRGDLWIIAAYEGRGGFGDRTLEKAAPWVRAHCHEVAAFGQYRLDYKRNASRVHRCSASHEPDEAAPRVERIGRVWP